ncbi:tripartite tricarboxylate transporter TctB family protein [Halomonas sp. MCCC 1A11036]|uniref:Tripartite tricarboxylate transporter TctB family protein n=1 Tax=Billgrantia zhangzhouensis TaxID=2733481 RepID=A0ABS9AGL3_9GAMM|nr:tripartite tricarboxylate transporter TctB family protein [Halomonas zhangzhouensis]MCE8020851.1 tripartite tricarboxylate transporter TctB family protein [Halomonas zhangzhouensis]
MAQRRSQEALLPSLQLVSYVAIASVALFMAIKAGSLPASRWEPMSSGAFPRIIFIAVALLCGAAFVTELMKRGMPRTNWAACVAQVHRLKMVFLNLALFIIYVISMPKAGFLLSTFIYLTFAQLLLAPKRPATIVLVLAVATFFSAGPYYLFSEVFNIYLPRARW